MNQKIIPNFLQNEFENLRSTVKIAFEDLDKRTRIDPGNSTYYSQEQRIAFVGTAAQVRCQPPTTLNI